MQYVGGKRKIKDKDKERRKERGRRQLDGCWCVGDIPTKVLVMVWVANSSGNGGKDGGGGGGCGGGGGKTAYPTQHLVHLE
ncbi:hypothetical protein M0804_000661 [Polistes exclamans]|nr:hypothetical protein M0804_000661 [Polistes exclamans]